MIDEKLKDNILSLIQSGYTKFTHNKIIFQSVLTLVYYLLSFLVGRKINKTLLLTSFIPIIVSLISTKINFNLMNNGIKNIIKGKNNNFTFIIPNLIILFLTSILPILIISKFRNNIYPDLDNPDHRNLIYFIIMVCLRTLIQAMITGIFSQSADVSADLLGKIDAGIPEDHPGNPLTILDNVGDQVNKFSTNIDKSFLMITTGLTSAKILGNKIDDLIDISIASFLPLLISPMILKFGSNPIFYLIFNNIFSIIIYFIIQKFYRKKADLKNFWCHCSSSIIGIISSVIFIKIINYQTKMISKQFITGPATGILSGISNSFKNTIISTILVSANSYISYKINGYEGLGISSFSLATQGFQFSLLQFLSPLFDNIGGILEMSNANKKYREISDGLDNFGIQIDYLNQNYTNIMNINNSITLLSQMEMEINIISILGIIIGSGLSNYLSGFLLDKISENSYPLIDNVRNYFRKNKITNDQNITSNLALSNLVNLSFKNILRSILPLIGPIIIIIFICIKNFDRFNDKIIFKEGLFHLFLGGLSMGNMINNILITDFSYNGNLFDNSKKFIEKTSKGSEQHKAAVVGDTIGDPFKYSIVKTIPFFNMFLLLVNNLINPH